MYWLRIVLAVVATVTFFVDFTVAEATGGQLDTGVVAGWLLTLGWAFGGGVKDAVKQRNGSGDE